MNLACLMLCHILVAIHFTVRALMYAYPRKYWLVYVSTSTH